MLLRIKNNAAVLAKQGSGIAVLAVIVSLLGGLGAPAQDAVQDGRFGFIVSSFDFAMPQSAITETPACPDGPVRNFAELYLEAHPEARPHDDASERRFNRLALNEAAMADDGRNLCLAPTAEADPGFRTVQGQVAIDGIDLDGQRSRADRTPAANTCAHDDFAGVDNQYFRAVGCIRGYQPGGIAREFGREMLSGSWSILFSLEGVDDLQNDPDVQVGLYAGADPIQLGADRSVLTNGSYAADPDPRYGATTRGRIVNGVLTTEPVDARFKFSANGRYYDRPLRAARVRVTIASDGSASGFLGGYSPIEEIYSNQVSFNGNTFVSVAAANAIGYTCNGLYAAMQNLADGHRDADTDRCTSISTQYRIEAVPAFVIHD